MVDSSPKKGVGKAHDLVKMLCFVKRSVLLQRTFIIHNFLGLFEYNCFVFLYLNLGLSKNIKNIFFSLEMEQVTKIK